MTDKLSAEEIERLRTGRKSNAPHDPGLRLVGFVVPEDYKGLPLGLMTDVLDALCDMALATARREEAAKEPGLHPSHVTRYSDSSLYDEVCVNCGATDRGGKLAEPCPKPAKELPGEVEGLRRDLKTTAADRDRWKALKGAVDAIVNERAAEILRLERELEEERDHHRSTFAKRRAAEARADALKRAVEEAIEALEPFAEKAGRFDAGYHYGVPSKWAPYGDDYQITAVCATDRGPMTVGQLRRARTVHAKLKGGGDGKR